MKRIIRPKTPMQRARFLPFIANMNFDNPVPTAYSDLTMNVQAGFDHLYAVSIELLDEFYPERTVVVTNRNPDHITPEIKYKLMRRKNTLMRAGRVEEATERYPCVSAKTLRNMARPDSVRLAGKLMPRICRPLTGRQQRTGPIDGITAESLNDHFAAISSDPDYSSPIRKTNPTPSLNQYVTEIQIYRILDKLRPTAMGLNGLPAWFLQLGAPALYKPITKLCHLSLATSYVPHQWKQASMLPIPKIAAPKLCAGFQPISITPVLTRIMERTVVQRFLYPAFLSPPPH